MCERGFIRNPETIINITREQSFIIKLQMFALSSGKIHKQDNKINIVFVAGLVFSQFVPHLNFQVG